MTATPLRDNPGTTQPAPVTPAVRELIESEARCHEAGAVLLPFAGGVIALTQRGDGRPLEVVVQRVQPAAIQSPLDEWLADIAVRLRDLGASHARIHLASRVFHLEAALRNHGYSPQQLRLLCGSTDDGSLSPASRETLEGFIGHQFSLESVGDQEGWRDLARILGEGLEREQRKAEAGFSLPYLVRHQGRLCGAFTAAPSGSLLRLDGPMTGTEDSPLGLAILRAALTVAADGGWKSAGAVLAADHPMLPVYRLAGFTAVGHLTEWTVRLD